VHVHDVDLTGREQASKKADKVARQKEMESWTARNGSEGLKQALQDGYDVSGRYVRERARIEYPGYAPAMEDSRIFINKRANPSDLAIAKLAKLKDRIASLSDDYRAGLGWVAAGSGIHEPALEWVCGEVVFLEGYLGNYLLLQPTDMRGPLCRFTRRLWSLSRVRTGLTPALKIVAEEEEDVYMKMIIGQIIELGKAEPKLGLGDAMQRVAPDVFSPQYLAILQSSSKVSPNIFRSPPLDFDDKLNLCLRELEAQHLRSNSR
jgi:hypothetical protein